MTSIWIFIFGVLVGAGGVALAHYFERRRQVRTRTFTFGSTDYRLTPMERRYAIDEFGAFD